MPFGILSLYVCLAVTLAFWPFRRIWLNKEVWVKRLNLGDLNRYGDMVFIDRTFHIHSRWSVKTFSLSDIQEIRGYSFTDWGLNEQEQVSIIFPNLNIILDAENETVQTFIKDLLQTLANDKEASWGFLPQLNDPAKRDLLYSKT